MKKIITLILCAAVFCGTMFLLAKPVEDLTLDDIIVQAVADTIPNDTEPTTATEPSTEPVETTADTTPEETQPIETQPVKDAPVKTTKPAETKPVETTEPTTPAPTEHQHNYTTEVTKPTCTEKGYTTYTCACGDSYKDNRTDARGHNYKTVTVDATCTKKGSTTKTCTVCGDTSVKTLDALGHNYKSKTKAPTCTKDGYTKYTCKRCDKSYTDNTIAAIGHHWADWEILKEATPDKSGKRQRFCVNCWNDQTENYTFEFAGNNAVYIPSADINVAFTEAEFNQASVDKYDVIYGYATQAKGPFILGHSHRVLGGLYNTEIGDTIYVKKDGKVIRYRVVVSEYALQCDNKVNMIGQTTGTSICKDYDAETLHMYTCYGGYADGRWMVLATRI